MSREVKRVPLDFKWPIRKVWSGYIMPDDLSPSTCPHCKNGYSAIGQVLADQWYGKAPFRPEDRGSVPFRHDGPEAQAWAKRQCERTPEFYGTRPIDLTREAVRICEIWNRSWSHHLNQDDVDALVAAGRLHDLTRTGHHPTADEVNRWSLFGFGHDSCNQWVVVKAEAARRGVSVTCEHCGGTGDVFRDDEHRQAYEDWEPTEPPEGTAWQMWETTSEGSPISPPCETASTLAKWLARTGASAFADDTATEQEWLTMIDAGSSVMSAVMVDGVMISGVAAVSLPQEPRG